MAAPIKEVQPILDSVLGSCTLSSRLFDSPYPVLKMGFTHNPLDRADHIRRDSAAIEALKSRPDARWLLFVDLKPLTITIGQQMDLLWLPLEELPKIEDWVFLGLDESRPRFAASIAVGESFPGRPSDSRMVGIQMMDPRGGLVAQARSLLAWHQRHKHCAVCGDAAHSVKGGYGRLCISEGCKAEHFPRVDPVSIMLVVADDKCLLGRQPTFPPGFYSALAGFIEPGETIEEAVRREVYEEAGIQVGRVQYIASQPWPFPSSLMIGCFAEAISNDIKIDETELEDARWFTRQEAEAALAGDGSFSPPPALAIAHHLLRLWVELR